MQRARGLLHELEGAHSAGGAGLGRASAGTHTAGGGGQLGLFAAAEAHLVRRLRALDPDALTPLEALVALADLRREASDAAARNEHERGV